MVRFVNAKLPQLHVMPNVKRPKNVALFLSAHSLYSKGGVFSQSYNCSKMRVVSDALEICVRNWTDVIKLEGYPYRSIKLLMKIISHNGEQVKAIGRSVKDKLNKEFEAVLSDNAANPVQSVY